LKYWHFQTVLRIWDCLFNEGGKVLLRAALVLVLNNKDQLLRCSNFSEVTDLFKKIEDSKQSLHCHTFVKVSQVLVSIDYLCHGQANACFCRLCVKVSPVLVFISSLEHKVLMVSYCGQWLSVVRRCPLTFDVYTLETTFVIWFLWNLIRMFVLTILRPS